MVPVVREGIACFEVEDLLATSPAKLGKPFFVPRLMVWAQGELAPADNEILAEYFGWSLAAHSAQLDEAAFRMTEIAELPKSNLMATR
jgi:hypothetical protein